MKAFIICASAAVFFILQAVYWIVSGRREARAATLMGRLGTDESLLESNTLLKGAGESAWVESLSIAAPLRDALEAAGEEGNVAAFFSRSLVFFLGTFAVFVVITTNFVGALLFAVVGASIPYLWLVKKKRARVARVEEQLPEALEVMIISLRAGQSLAQTIRLTSEEADAPIGEEFRRVAEEQSLGRPLDEALVAMSQRVREARTIRTFVVSVLVLRQTGGNLVEVLESIIDTMRQQTQYERKLKAMTAEGRSSSRMLAMLPPAFTGLAYMADPSYVGRLIDDSVGRALLTVAAILYLLGVLWVRRLVRPKR